MNKLEIRFNEYQRLAESYARKIFNYDSIAYEQDDIIQEFRIKLYEVILAYERAKKNVGNLEESHQHHSLFI
jgi:hypothetical protein